MNTSLDNTLDDWVIMGASLGVMAISIHFHSHLMLLIFALSLTL